MVELFSIYLCKFKHIKLIQQGNSCIQPIWSKKPPYFIRTFTGPLLIQETENRLKTKIEKQVT